MPQSPSRHTPDSRASDFRFCEQCQCKRPYVEDPAAHLLHFALTILTLGFVGRELGRGGDHALALAFDLQDLRLAFHVKR